MGLTMVHSQCTAEQRYLMVKTSTHNNKHLSKYFSSFIHSRMQGFHTNQQLPKTLPDIALIKPARNGERSGKPKI